MNPDDAEDSLVRALMEPLPKTGYLTEAVRHMTAHARHRRPEDFVAACAETTEHFRSIPPPSRHGKTKLLLASLLGLAVAAAFIVPGAARRELKLMLVTQAGQLPYHSDAALNGQRVIRERILSRVSPADGEILFGDLNARTAEDRWKALAEREPTNPGRYADAALGYLKSNGELPPDFVEKGEALDPGNGWYAYFKARIQPLLRADSGTVIEGLWDQTVAAPRFEDPTRKTWDERIALLPEENLWADVVAASRFTNREMVTPGERFLIGMERFVVAAAIERATDDPVRLNELTQVWMQLFSNSLAGMRTGSELTTLIEDPFQSALTGPQLPTFLSGEGFSKEGGIFADLEVACTAALPGPPTPAPTSLLATRTSTIPSHDPTLTRPGIAAEWAMHERLIGWGSVLLLGLLLLIHLAVLQSNRGFDRLAERLGQILRRSDYLLIFLIALGLPLLLYAIATRLPGHGLLTMPLAQEKDPRFTLLAILHGAWILAVPLLALEATRWRLAVRGRALGMAGRGLHLGMVPLAMLLGTLIGATVLPAIPAVWSDPKLPLLGLAGGLAIGALWLLVLIFWHFAAPRESFPERLLRLRIVFWPVLAALLVTAAGMVALREHERHLVSINRFEKSPRTHAGNPTAADQEFLETWKPKLLEAVRKAREDLEALE